MVGTRPRICTRTMVWVPDKWVGRCKCTRQSAGTGSRRANRYVFDGRAFSGKNHSDGCCTGWTHIVLTCIRSATIRWRCAPPHACGIVRVYVTQNENADPAPDKHIPQVYFYGKTAHSCMWAAHTSLCIACAWICRTASQELLRVVVLRDSRESSAASSRVFAGRVDKDTPSHVRAMGCLVRILT